MDGTRRRKLLGRRVAMVCATLFGLALGGMREVSAQTSQEESSCASELPLLLSQTIARRDGRDAALPSMPGWTDRYWLAVVIDDFNRERSRLASQQELPPSLRLLTRSRVFMLRDQAEATDQVCDIVRFMLQHGYEARDDDPPVGTTARRDPVAARSRKAGSGSPAPAEDSEQGKHPSAELGADPLTSPSGAAPSESSLLPTEREVEPELAVDSAPDRERGDADAPFAASASTEGRRASPDPSPSEVSPQLSPVTPVLPDRESELERAKAGSSLATTPPAASPVTEADGESEADGEFERMAIELDRLLRVPAYLTLRDLRVRKLRIPNTELQARQRKALAARSELLSLLERMLAQYGTRPKRAEPRGKAWVEQVGERLEQVFAGEDGAAGRERALRLWKEINEESE